MSRRRRAAPVKLPPRPPMPMSLCVYSSTEWGGPPWDQPGGDPAGWEAGHREAYQKYEAARRSWLDEHGHLRVNADAPGDQPWCGAFIDHDCPGVECQLADRASD